MSDREVISFPEALVEVEVRSRHLFVVERGHLRDLSDVRRYTDALNAIVLRTGIDHAVVDARGDVAERPFEVRDAMWRWLTDPDGGLSVVAFVVASERTMGRIDMMAQARGARVRAFETVTEAERWLSAKPRRISDQRVRSSSQRPAVDPDPPRTPAPLLYSPGLYFSSKPRIDRTRHPERPLSEQASRARRTELKSDIRPTQSWTDEIERNSDDDDTQVA